MVYNIHFSPTGGTRRVSEFLLAGFGESYHTIDLCDGTTDFSGYEFKPEDVCFVSVPAYAGRVPAIARERLLAITGRNTPAIPVVVFGNRAIDDALLELKDILADRGFCAIGGVSAVAEHSIVRQVAAGRPNIADRGELRSFGAQIKAKLSGGDRTPVDFPGNRPYRAYGATPFKPTGNANCIHCGVCAQQCPVSAIPEDDFSGVDAGKCISCFRCIRVCPTHCRSVNPRPMAVTAAKLKAGCGEPKENTLFLS